jgi:acyl homoserine lactone synthase
MFVTIQAHEYAQHSKLLQQMFKLRKKVFFDQLNWNVDVVGDQEFDIYDELKPVYLLWVSKDFGDLYGCIRLMPTTGPTLLYDVFRKTFPQSLDLVAPDIWEGTRMCIDENKIARDHPDINSNHAFSLMLLALCECALAHGIHTMISNYEPHMRRIYHRTGIEVEELGRADGYGRLPVCCGTFEVSQKVLVKMRATLKNVNPVFENGPRILSNRSNFNSKEKLLLAS